jgi:PAS domain S-box-containing protein
MPVKKQPTKEPAAAQLRQQAETWLQDNPAEHAPGAEHVARQLLHELEVHQIELELQNAELRRAREEMEEVLERYTELYDFAPVGYFTLSRTGVISVSNLAGASLLGLERSRLMGRNFGDFLAPEDRAAFASFLDRVGSGGDKMELETGLLPQGEGSPKLFVRLEGSASSAGQLFRVAVLDITKRKQVEDELGRYREHLEWLVAERTLSLEAEITERRRAELEVKELNASLEQRVVERTGELEATIRDLQTFSYSVSHDLRTPLRSINSFAAVLLEDYSQSLNDEGKRLLNSIVKRTVNMGILIDDLLSFAKNSRQKLAIQEIDMAGLARGLVEKLSSEGAGSCVEFRVGQLPQASGDSSMIAQVLENLVSNAVKFSGKVEKPVVQLGFYQGEGEQVYFVKDNGIGFDMKYVNAIFGVFQRLHNSEDFEGTGVGLAIVEQIITKHGGKVWAESAPGEGATFYFSLPMPSPNGSSKGA